MPELEHFAELNELVTREIGFPIVTKWLLIGEGIDEDGLKSSFSLSADGCTPWDEFGLMAWHKQYRIGQNFGADDD